MLKQEILEQEFSGSVSVKGVYMLIFGKGKKKDKGPSAGSYDRENQMPVVRCSICNGEKVAGFRNIHTGAFSEIMLIRTDSDLEKFRSEYGISEEIRYIY